MKKVLLTMSAVLMMSSAAYAVPINSGVIEFTNGGNKVNVEWEAEDAGDGLTRYLVFLNDPTDATLSYFLQGLTFTGTINQDKAGFGKNANKIVVDDEDSAVNVWDDPPSYTAALDSWFSSPWTENTTGTGITDSTSPTFPEGPVVGRAYGITAGSGGGSKLDFVQVGQIVASGDVVVSGVLGRNGLTFNAPPAQQATMTGTPIPEPSTLALMGLGAVGMVGLARRRKSS